MLSTSFFAISFSRFPDFQLLRHVQFFGVGQFLGEMHQFQDERILQRFHAGQILARLDHDFGDADLLVFASVSRSST